VSEKWKIIHISDTITSQQDNVGGNGLHHCSSEIKLVLNDISHAPPSHLKFQSWIQDGGLQDGGHGTHVTHFVQLYPQLLYTASQVRTTSRSWDKGVLTDLCLTRVLTDLCLTLYIDVCVRVYIYIYIYIYKIDCMDTKQ